MAKKKQVKKPVETSKEKTFHQELFSRMLALATSGFGLVAALAWNDAIQALINNFVKTNFDKYFQESSAIWTKLIYALVITFLAVLITYQLSRITARFDKK